MVVFDVLLQVIGEFFDLFGQESDLHFSRSGVGLMLLRLLDDRLLLSFCQHTMWLNPTTKLRDCQNQSRSCYSRGIMEQWVL